MEEMGYEDTREILRMKADMPSSVVKGLFVETLIILTDNFGPLNMR